MGRLGITHAEMAACDTMQDLQHLARVRYRQLAKRLHPDHVGPRKRHGGGRPVNGWLFRQITNTYAWVCKLEPCLLVDTVRPLVIPEMETMFPEPDPDLGWGWHIAWY